MKLQKNKLTVTIIVLSVTFLGLIVFSASKEPKNLNSSAGNVLNPIQKVAYNMNRSVKDFVDFFLNFSEVKEENKELSSENKDLKNKLAEYSNLAEENERLKKILDFKEQRKDYDYIVTNIIGVSGAGILDGYIVDRGSSYGIEKGMIVISADGLVGQVSSVGDNWSIIQCIVNENIAVSVMGETSRDNTGILKGHKENRGQNLTIVENLPIDSNIQEGEVILTSGLGKLYPKEIRVGEVVSVEEDKVKVMKRAIVKPYVDFNKLDELVIVAPKDKREIIYN